MERYEAWLNKEWTPQTEARVAAVLRRGVKNTMVVLILATIYGHSIGGFPWSGMANPR